MNGINNGSIADSADVREISIEEILPRTMEAPNACGVAESDEPGQSAESAAAEMPVSSGHRLRRGLRAVCCTVLGSIGFFCYVGLGCGAVEYLREGGFGETVANSIFGGSVTTVEAPITPIGSSTDKEENTKADAENSTNAEYIETVSENIGCDDPNTVFNETKYSVDISTLSVAAAVTETGGEKAVLIIHTHGTEAYAPEQGGVTSDDTFRSTDVGKNVVAVGKAFAEKLTECGIKVYHCETMFDEEEYVSAYERSAKAVLEYRERYPEIAYVLDIHRDAVIRENGAVVRSDGGSGAQLMIICGTDEMGADFPDWRENLAFGTAYQRRLWEREPRIVRRMNLRSASFNQQLCDRYILLEVGTCGNTVEEAKISACLAAEELAGLLSAER